jgi:hypothetical protein
LSIWPGKKINNVKRNNLGKNRGPLVEPGEIEKADGNHPPLIVFDLENKPC